jgi:hypothetical protein
MPEHYEPTEREQHIAEEFLTVDDWQRLSDERVEALKDSVPGQLHPKLFTLLNRLDERLFDLHRLDGVAETEGLVKKPEFHTTLIGFSRGKEVKTKLAMMKWEKREEVKIALDQLVQNMDWTPIKADPVTYRIAKDYVKVDNGGQELERERRQSIIQFIGFRGTEKFFAQLNALLGTSFDPPPTHVTLYTNSTNPKNMTLGIGISTKEDVDQLRPEPIMFSENV